MHSGAKGLTEAVNLPEIAQPLCIFAGGMWMHGLGLLAKARQLFGPQAVLYSSVAAACHSCQMWELAARFLLLKGAV